MESHNDFTAKINSLPSLPPVLTRIRQVMSQPECSARDIVDVLKLDPSISGKVLRLANSAYIGIPRTVSSLQNAVVILGQQRIYSVVLAASALSRLPADLPMPFSIADFWKHSVTTALVCESIARHLQRYDTIESGEFFCAGILHDIGRLALGVYDTVRVNRLLQQAQERRQPLFEVEEPEHAHTQTGYHLANHWNFPENLLNAILYHHQPRHSPGSGKTVAIVHLADIMAHLMGFQTVPGETVGSIDQFAVDQIQLQPERLRMIAYEACEDEKRIEEIISALAPASAGPGR